ncbi:kirola-like [Lycium barbarum]|uniref:kirola-like n=1 Tax=Lycium barbarum TaxID=112863 RepID=UPI00293F798D|nr:kirola-like [Lycium barbarum]
MGVKGKLISSIEVKCGGHPIHDIFHTNSDLVPNISPHVNHFEIHEGEILKVGSVVSWKYIEDGKEKYVKDMIEAINPQKKSITWKVIEGDRKDLYNSFIVITFSEDQWTTVRFEYEKKTDPLPFLGYFLYVIKDIEKYLLKK